MTKPSTIRIASVDHLTQLALAGEDGRFWYHHALAEVVRASRNLDTPLPYLVAVLGVTSPRVSVRDNINLTTRYILQDSIRGLMPSVIVGLKKLQSFARDDLHGMTSTMGPKTGPFARALAGDEDAVPLDIWMARALKVEQSKLSGKRVNKKCSDRVRAVAARLGWTPAQTQAAIWTAAYRRHFKNGNPPAFTFAL